MDTFFPQLAQANKTIGSNNSNLAKSSLPRIVTEDRLREVLDLQPSFEESQQVVFEVSSTSSKRKLPKSNPDFNGCCGVDGRS